MAPTDPDGRRSARKMRPTSLHGDWFGSEDAGSRASRLRGVASDMVAQARALAGEHLALLSSRWRHVEGVAASACDIALRIDPEHACEIVAAAWLHDVGYADDLGLTGFHPLDGARFAWDVGLPPLVVSLIAFHTGAEFEARQRGLVAQLNEFSAPPREILDIVTYSDVTTSPDGELVAAEKRIAEILHRYAESDPVHAAVAESAPALLASVARVEARLVASQPK